MNTDEDMVWTCQYCGVQNTVWVDLTEDCRICCRPNRIIITTGKIEEEAFIEARPSDE